MELTNEEKQIIVNLLSQISLSVNDARRVIEIIDKLNSQIAKEPQLVEEVKE